ncbi:hypothetical protein DRQ25_15570 [Candidatus Fermentibacteria bacterium]|nr:MAG: hypothetical protein DRQ25_15570 [Candidatus Fermentibacteria bacterium]
MAKRVKLRLSDPRVKQTLSEMGVSQADLDSLSKATTHAEGEAMLDKLKVKTKKGYRALAHELHPDKTGNDPEKTEMFKFVKSIYEGFAAAEFIARPRPMVFRVSHMYGRQRQPSETGDAAIDELLRQQRKANEQQASASAAETWRKIFHDEFVQSNGRRGDWFRGNPTWMDEDASARQAEAEKLKEEEERERRRAQKAEHVRTVDRLQQEQRDRQEFYDANGHQVDEREDNSPIEAGPGFYGKSWG